MPNRFARSYRRRTLLLLLLVLIVDYADRTLIGALGPTLKSVYHIGNTHLGLLAGAFCIVGAIATIPFSMLTDRASRTTLLAVSLALWSVAEGVTGAANSFTMLFGARACSSVLSRPPRDPLFPHSPATSCAPHGVRGRWGCSTAAN